MQDLSPILINRIEAIKAMAKDDRVEGLEGQVASLTKQIEALDDRLDSLHHMVYHGEPL